MKSTFHELELGKAVLQNASAEGTEQLIVTLRPEDQSSVQIQIKKNTGGDRSVTDSISIDQHGLQKLFQWLREEGVVS